MVCIKSNSTVGVIVGTIGLAADVIIFVLPIPIIAKLHIPPLRKFGVAIVFLAGLL